MNEFCDKIREARLAKGLMSKKVAEMVGISAVAMSRIEKGHNKPSIATLINLCRVLDMDLVTMARLGQYSEKWLKELLTHSDEGEKLIVNFNVLSQQDRELVSLFAKGVSDLTTREKDTIRFILSYGDASSV